MAREDFQTSERILQRIDKLEDASSVRINSAIGRLSMPLSKVEYGNSGEINLAGENWRMHFAYGPSDKESVDGVGDGGQWRTLSTALIETKDRSIDLTRLLPRDRKIYLRPNTHEVYGEVRQKDGVLLWGNLSTPIVLAILLHEIGHVVDMDQLEKEGALGLLTSIDAHEYSGEAAVLRRERVASAFALKMMRPFLNKVQREDMVLYLKHYALKSYYKDAKRAIAAREATKADITRQAQQDYAADEQWLDEYAVWEDFLEWKKSDGYTTWKEANKDLEEHEEFGKWRKERNV